MFTYIPKKSKEIYKEIIAHRGYHYHFPENTLPAYEEALNKNYAIELDIRLTKDKKIICLHDRYTKRLLGIKGKVSNMLYIDLLKYNIQKSNFKIPTLGEVLELVNGRTTLLLEVKGLLNNEFKTILTKELSNYRGRVYFHAKNLITYYKLKEIYGEKVFWVLNPFRRRFNFIRPKMYT